MPPPPLLSLPSFFLSLLAAMNDRYTHARQANHPVPSLPTSPSSSLSGSTAAPHVPPPKALKGFMPAALLCDWGEAMMLRSSLKEGF